MEHATPGLMERVAPGARRRIPALVPVALTTITKRMSSTAVPSLFVARPPWRRLRRSASRRRVELADLAPKPLGIPFQEVCNHGELTDGVPLEQLRKRSAGRNEQRASRGRAVFDRFDQHTTTVSRIGNPAHEPFALEPVYQVRDRGCCEARVPRDLSGALGSKPLENAERLVVGWMQTEPRSQHPVKQHRRVAVLAPDTREFLESVLPGGALLRSGRHAAL